MELFDWNAPMVRSTKVTSNATNTPSTATDTRKEAIMR